MFKTVQKERQNFITSTFLGPKSIVRGDTTDDAVLRFLFTEEQSIAFVFFRMLTV